MSLRIRLSRGGAKKRPYYRIVVTDSRNPRDGRFLERVGSYNPMVPRDHAERIRLDEERIKFWLDRGALPSDRVAGFLGQADIIPMPSRRETPKKSAPRAKTLERMKAAEEAAAAPPPPPEAEAPAEGAEEAATEEAPTAEAAAEEAPAEETAVEAETAEAAPEAEAEAATEESAGEDAVPEAEAPAKEKTDE